MAEDVEINMLLQSTQDMFEESYSNGSEDNSENSESDFMVQTQQPTQDGFEILISDDERSPSKDLKRKLKPKRKRTNINSFGKQKRKKSCDAENKKSKRFKSINEDQRLHDDEVISQKAEEIRRHVYSQEILSGSESDNDDPHDSQCFINELTADDELPYRGSFIEEIRQQVGSKGIKQPKDSIVKELNAAQRLLLEKDDLLRNLERKLQEYISDNKEKQSQIQEAIATLTQNDTIRCTGRQPSFTRNFFKKFGMPYFEDTKGFTCAPNEDVMKKFTEKQLNLLSVPKVYFWSKLHNDILFECIRNTLVEEHTERFTKEIFKLNEALKRGENVDETAEKIEELQQSIRDVRKESYRSLVSKEDPNREYDWMKYSASHLDGLHSADECRRFWHTYLKPSINKSKWTAEEDSKLGELVEQNHGQDWDKIARLLGTDRTPFQCFIHYQTRIDINHQYSTGKWTKEEDDSLMKIVNISRHGDYIPWTKVAAHFPNRSHYQVYTRWKNCLNPKLVKGRFSKEEDVLVVAGLEVFGANYSELASLMGNRSVCQIRDRYERHLLPKTSKIGTWTLKEDSELLRLVELHGKRWVVVSKHIKTRSRTQVRQRYNTIQNMMKMRPGWTIEKSRRINCTVDLGKSLKTTWKIVETIKKEVDAVEQSFNLSTLEKETFRLEKLKELKDSIMLKKFSVKRKKKGGVKEKFDMSKRLMEYFKPSCSNPLIKPSLKVCDKLDYKPYLNQLVVNSRMLGFELDLPKSVKDVTNNPWLNRHVKFLLKENIKNNEKSKEDLPEDEGAVMESIDYTPPSDDDTIIAKEWWYTTPIDISTLNFSELFKRTVFDYSNGMHSDIWTSKMNRVDNSMPDAHYLDFEKNQPYCVSPIVYPPNLLSTLLLRTMIMSRSRIKKDIAGKGLSKKVKVQKPFEKSDQGDSNEGVNVQEEQGISNVEPSRRERNLNVEGLFIQHTSQFNETLGLLCTWSKFLSLVHINNTNYSKTYTLNTKDDGKYVVSKVLTLINEQNELSDDDLHNSSLADDKVKNVDKRNFETRKRANKKRGNKCARKVKIEHLIKPGCKKQLHLPKGRKVKKSKIGLQPKKHSIDKLLRNKKKVCNPDEVIDLENYENLSVMIPENTYKKKTEPSTPSCSATENNQKGKSL